MIIFIVCSFQIFTDDYSNVNSSELSSQLDDLMGYSGLDDGGCSLSSSMSSYRNPMLMDDPFSHHNPASSLISLELSPNDDYNFELNDQEGITDLFDADFE